MTSRENFAKIIHHEIPDHIVIDFGGCPLSRIEPDCEKRLLDYLGFPSRPPDHTPGSRRVDERLMQYFGVEVRAVGGMMKPQHSLYRKLSDTEYIDHWGIRKRFTGLYWDIVESPLRNATMEDLKRYPWPDGDDIDEELLAAYVSEAKSLWQNTDYILCAEHPVYGVFEMGCWLFGFDTFLMKMALEPEFVLAFFDIFWDYQQKVIRKYYQALGPYIQYTSSGDDFATQNGPFFSPNMFDELVAPYYEKRIRLTKQYISGAYLHHSCGSVVKLIPSIIRCEVDILNPMQPKARDMNFESIKAEFGRSLVFHGGFDTQEILPKLSRTQIDEEVCRLMETLGKGGGYIFAAAHNIQADVSPENIVYLMESAQKHCRDF